MVSGTCRSYICKGYKCVENLMRKKMVPPNPTYHVLGPSFDQQSIKKDGFKKSSKKRSTKNINRYQNSSKIKARTGNGKDQGNHQKSSLDGQIIEIHCKNKCLRWPRKLLHVWTRKVSKKIKNDTQIHPKIDEQSIQKSCSEKEYPKDESYQTNYQKITKEKKRKTKCKTNITKRENRGTGREAGLCRGVPRTLKVKDRRETNRRKNKR